MFYISNQHPKKQKINTVSTACVNRLDRSFWSISLVIFMISQIQQKSRDHSSSFLFFAPNDPWLTYRGTHAIQTKIFHFYSLSAHNAIKCNCLFNRLDLNDHAFIGKYKNTQLKVLINMLFTIIIFISVGESSIDEQCALLDHACWLEDKQAISHFT